jgi:uncharacterized protein YigE (DUF2233 family)
VIGTLAALIFATLPVQAPAAGAEAVAWKQVQSGVEHLHIGELDAELFRFDLRGFEVEVLVPGRDHRQTAAELRRQRDGVLAVNGGFFDTDARPLGLRVSGKRVVIPLRPRVDWGVLVVRDGGASIVHSREYVADAGITAAVQVGPRLLIGGRPTDLKPQAARRTAVALDRDGRFLTFIVTRVRVDAGALARALAGLGFDRALMFDGGPSTQLSVALPGHELEIVGGYPVPDGVVVRPRARSR